MIGKIGRNLSIGVDLGQLTGAFRFPVCFPFDREANGDVREAFRFGSRGAWRPWRQLRRTLAWGMTGVPSPAPARATIPSLIKGTFMTTESDQPFAGVRVVEFGQFVAVPYAAQLLGEGGAEVIKVEALEGDPTRRLNPIAPSESRTFISRNRSKRALPLSLSDPTARPVIDALLGWADVVLTNFRPGLAEKLGLDWDSLKGAYPRLVVGAVSPFGKHGPDAGLAGMDIVVQARSGLMAANGRIVDGRPAAGDPVSADYMCAMSLAFGVSAALLRREKTGRGGSVDVSLMRAAMTLANNQLLRADRFDLKRNEAVLEELRLRRENKATFEEQLSVIPSARAMPLLKVYFRTYETADNVIAVACGSQKLRESFITATGLSDPGLQATDLRGWDEHYDALQAQAETLFRTQPSSHWVQALSAEGVPVSPVRFPIELFDDEQAVANGFFHRIEHPLAGDIQVLAPPVELDAGGFTPGFAMAPFGSETRSLLAELGFAGETIDSLISAGATHAGSD